MRHILVAGIAISAVVLQGGVLQAQVPGLPTKFTNLKVLPKDIAQPALVAVMRDFSIHLGVRCQFCHLGEGNDLSKFDFAADEKPTKATARRMLTMVGALNNEYLKDVGDPARTPKVTCFTCHRGMNKPG